MSRHADTDVFLVVLTTDDQEWHALHVFNTQTEAEAFVRAAEQGCATLRDAAKQDRTFMPYGGWDETVQCWVRPKHPMVPSIPFEDVLYGGRFHVARVPVGGLWRRWLRASAEDWISEAKALGSPRADVTEAP